MKNIFEQQTVNELTARINNLSGNEQAQWGKMNLYQMLVHCADNEEMMTLVRNFKPVWIGKIFGKMSLKANIKNDNPLKPNSPTHPDLKPTGVGNIEEQKQRWINTLAQYPTKTEEDYANFKHPFYGKMNTDQISRWVYKHVDHHLTQFGV